ncbi:hypothetical protein BKA66DRAFT_408587 [Pyrenochaeta sp. MPI-SDFR-AT-0127]|nr:hypothetical protein BKA66DRAFT_408587 [Pyrenochaeta sp. MPI-SDFR-AT-0127]
MQKARASSSFHTFELTCLIWGGENAVRKRRTAFERVERRLGTYDTAKVPNCYAHTSREDYYKQGLEMGKACLDDMTMHDHDLFVWITPRYNLINASPFGHKAVLFEPAIEHNGTEEQKLQWLQLARPGRILGTYAQTELGHGSFVRGIETTATFDPKTDEFIIHSPTLSSTKFWPAGLGFSTTHAVVMARLISGTNDHGPHLFIVQLRGLDDGKSLPGINLGDIGSKMGYNHADNGFASFTHVRIPRAHMLMAHSQLSRNGTYSADKLRTKSSYSVMLLVRSKMPSIFALQLAQATTIAARYSVVREQGRASRNAMKAETAIIQYKHQQFRLLALISKSYAMFFAAQVCEGQYSHLRQMQGQGDHSLLPALHALTAGLKAYVTSEAADGAEDARKLCGGHGYMAISGLPDIIGACAGGTTFEGENYVLWQQVGRYLLKQVDLLRLGKEIDAQVRYLSTDSDCFAPCTASGKQFTAVEVQLSIYSDRAHRLILKAWDSIHKSDRDPDEAWNEHMILIISASRAHIEYLVVKAFADKISSLSKPTSSQVRVALTNLCSLFALSTIVNPGSTDAISFVETRSRDEAYFSSAQLDTIRALVHDLLDQILPEAIALTDAWDFSDASLCSALGMYDGNVYDNIMQWVKQLPINKASGERRGIYPDWENFAGEILKAGDQKSTKL